MWTHCIAAELLCLQSFGKVWLCSHTARRKKLLCQLKCERKQTHPRWFLFDENSIWLCFEPPTFSKARRANGNIMRIPPSEFTPFFYWPLLWSMFWRVIKKQEMSKNINKKKKISYDFKINKKDLCSISWLLSQAIKANDTSGQQAQTFLSLLGCTSKTYGSQGRKHVF